MTSLVEFVPELKNILKDEEKEEKIDMSKKICLYVPGTGEKTDVCYSKSVVTSWLQKSIRRGNWKQAAMAAMILAENEPWYFWHRMRIIAIEDLLDIQLFGALYGMQKEFEAICGKKKPCTQWDAVRLAIAAAIVAAERQKDRRADEMIELVAAWNAAKKANKEDEELEELWKEMTSVPEYVYDSHVVKGKDWMSWYEYGSVCENKKPEYAKWREKWERIMVRLTRMGLEW